MNIFFCVLAVLVRTRYAVGRYSMVLPFCLFIFQYFFSRFCRFVLFSFRFPILFFCFFFRFVSFRFFFFFFSSRVSYFPGRKVSCFAVSLLIYIFRFLIGFIGLTHF